jgi:hypothetical protein
MSNPPDKGFANLLTQLHRDLPLEPLTRLVNRAAIALGLLRSKSLPIGQLLTATPLAGTRDRLKKRGQRFLSKRLEKGVIDEDDRDQSVRDAPRSAVSTGGA